MEQNLEGLSIRELERIATDSQTKMAVRINAGDKVVEELNDVAELGLVAAREDYPDTVRSSARVKALGLAGFTGDKNPFRNRLPIGRVPLLPKVVVG